MNNKNNKNAHLPADTNTTVHTECNTTTTKRSSDGFTAIHLTWRRILWHFVLAAVVPFALSTGLRRQTSLFASWHASVGKEEQEKVCRVWHNNEEWSKSECSSSLELYHETLVHPALLSHKSPQQVALVVASPTISRDMVVGSLHQVLKHTTVQHCHVLHLVHDNENENENKHGSDLNDDLLLSSNWKDDPRVHLTTVTNLETARTWFLDHYGSAANDNEEEEEEEEDDDDKEEISDNKLDVILLDTLLYVHAPECLVLSQQLLTTTFF